MKICLSSFSFFPDVHILSSTNLFLKIKFQFLLRPFLKKKLTSVKKVFTHMIVKVNFL